MRQLEHEMDEKEKQEYFGNCDACGKEVIGERQACQAMEKIYHSDCFVCCACGRSLKEKEFYNVNGTIYCEEDYLVRSIVFLKLIQKKKKLLFWGISLMKLFEINLPKF